MVIIYEDKEEKAEIEDNWQPNRVCQNFANNGHNDDYFIENAHIKEQLAIVPSTMRSTAPSATIYIVPLSHGTRR